MTNHYEFLGLDPGCTSEDVRKAYKRLALKYHPDRGTGNAEKFQMLTLAVDVLSDPRTRREHDRNLGLPTRFDYDRPAVSGVHETRRKENDQAWNEYQKTFNARRRNSMQPSPKRRHSTVDCKLARKNDDLDAQLEAWRKEKREEQDKAPAEGTPTEISLRARKIKEEAEEMRRRAAELREKDEQQCRQRRERRDSQRKEDLIQAKMNAYVQAELSAMKSGATRASSAPSVPTVDETTAVDSGGFKKPATPLRTASPSLSRYEELQRDRGARGVLDKHMRPVAGRASILREQPGYRSYSMGDLEKFNRTRRRASAAYAPTAAGAS